MLKFILVVIFALDCILCQIALPVSVPPSSCTSNDECTTICTVAFQNGTGTCLPGANGTPNYCICGGGCPQLTVIQEGTVTELCSEFPLCQTNCPNAIAQNELYVGHLCQLQSSLICTCFCLPLNVNGIIVSVTCPFVQ